MKFFLMIFSVVFAFGEYFYSNGKKIELNLDSISRSGIKYYKLPNGEKVGVGDTILVKFKDENISVYLDKYNLKVLKKYRNNLYLLKTPINEAINISNELYNQKDVVYAHPNFSHIIHKR